MIDEDDLGLLLARVGFWNMPLRLDLLHGTWMTNADGTRWRRGESGVKARIDERGDVIIMPVGYLTCCDVTINLPPHRLP